MRCHSCGRAGHAVRQSLTRSEADDSGHPNKPVMEFLIDHLALHGVDEIMWRRRTSVKHRELLP